MSKNSVSRSGLVFCVAASLAASGCASGSMNRLMGKKAEPSPKLTLAWSKLKEDEGRLTEARGGYETVLKKEPKNVDAILGMARLDEKAQRLVPAEEGYTQALALKPKSPYVLSEVGKFYALQQRWDKAVPLLQKAQQMEPHEKSHHFTLAMALTKAGRTDEALPHFTEAVGEAAAHYNIGRMLVESGKTTEAEQQFTLALAKDPKLDDAQFFLDEIRNNTTKPGQQPPIVAQPKVTAPVTQRVSGTISNRPTVTPATDTSPQIRPAATRPHTGYEELPSPPEMMDGGSVLVPKNDTAALQFTQVGYTPASTPTSLISSGSGTAPRLLPAFTANGAQVRVSASQQFPLGR
jgi:Tfp pilus assembly protein PilF